MIIRFLLFLAVFWLLSKLLKKMMAAQIRRPDPPPSWPGKSRVDGGELVQDPRCGVYVPKATAVQGRDGASFCSEACRDAYESGNA